MQKKWVQLLLRRRVYVIVSLLLQIALMIFMVYSSSQAYRWIYNALYLVSLAVVLHVISNVKRSPYKLLWSVVVLSFPLFGGLLYLMVRFQGMTMGFKKQLAKAQVATKSYREADPKVAEAMQRDFPEYAPQCHYLTNTCGFRGYIGEKIQYLSPGEEKFKALISCLEQAERFIFLEYFIIQEGRMWNTILDVLKRKAAEGLDVRMIYDDMGCFMLLPLDYQKMLSEMGIRCEVFNKFRPVLSTLQNHRDHRKIAVIDGKWAFTGGVNLSDEYINDVARFGHWKDASIMVSGEAASSFTLMFLEMWQALTGEADNLESFLAAPTEVKQKDGYVIPYCDSPIDEEYVGEKVYMNLICAARQYLYIQTPYLIIDDALVSALILAAKNGVDVKILTPGKPDKWYVHMTTQSYYRELLSGGVQIYEYTPGFLHSKVMVSDDKAATVGTVNLDCRSLYLHFECGAWICGSQSVKEIREDFEATLSACKKISASDCRVGLIKRLVQSLFRLIAPLM